MRGSAARGRHAECAYQLDRAVRSPGSTEEVARAAIDALRLALRPSYAAFTCRLGQRRIHCGDAALAADLEVIFDLLGDAPRSILATPGVIRRSEAARLGLASLERPMAASALDLVVPVALDTNLLGVVAVGPRADRLPWTGDDLELCDALAARLALVASRESLAAEVAGLRSSLAASERLASVGRMAAGLAHEIRNPLVSIRTFTQLLPERHGDDEFRSDFLDLTLSEIDRISSLVGDILSFARPDAAEPDAADAAAAADVAETVEKTCMLLRSHARSSGVALECRAADLAERGAIDEDRLRQVVINLVVNGIQACDGRGRVRVDVAHGSSGRIAVTVADDGPGMERDVAARIFEPFFTTRREGTGLGLALVKRILDDAGALIRVDTQPGRGTCFVVEIPTETTAAQWAVAADGAASAC